MCIGPTRRHWSRRTVRSNSFARCSQISQFAASALKPPVDGGADREQAEAVLAGRARARRRDLRRDADLDVRPRVGRELEARVAQREPVGLRGHDLAAQQRHEHVDRLVHHVALLAATSMPIMNASDGSAPGPTPNITRPRVMWSSWLMRSASISGWW